MSLFLISLTPLIMHVARDTVHLCQTLQVSTGKLFSKAVGCSCLKLGMCLWWFKALTASSKTDSPRPSETGPIPRHSGGCEFPAHWLHLALGWERRALYFPAACLDLLAAFNFKQHEKNASDIAMVAVCATATWHLKVTAGGWPSVHSARTQSQPWQPLGAL